MVYVVLIILCVLFILLENARGCDWAIPYLRWGTVLFLIFFVGLRYLTGPDYDSYESMYFGRSEYQFEPLFQLFIWIFREMNVGYNLFLLFIAGLSIVIKAHVIHRYSPYFFLSVLVGVGFFLSDMGQIRYALAISVLWLSLPFCMDRKIVPFLLVVTCAALIHQTAVVFLPVYWLINVKLRFPAMLLVWALCYVASFTILNTWVMDFFSQYSFSEITTTKIDTYSDSHEMATRYAISFFGLASKIGLLALVYYANIRDAKLKRLYVNINFIGGCLLFFFSFSEILSSRLSAYFLSFDALMVPVALATIKSDFTYYILLFVLVAKYVYQAIFQVYFNYPEMYLPYQNVLFN